MLKDYYTYPVISVLVKCTMNRIECNVVLVITSILPVATVFERYVK